MTNLSLAVNQDLKSRVTYSVITKRLHRDSMREFIHRELDRIGLALGYDFPSAIGVLEQWLRRHRQQHVTSNA